MGTRWREKSSEKVMGVAGRPIAGDRTAAWQTEHGNGAKRRKRNLNMHFEREGKRENGERSRDVICSRHGSFFGCRRSRRSTHTALLAGIFVGGIRLRSNSTLACWKKAAPARPASSKSPHRRPDRCLSPEGWLILVGWNDANYRLRTRRL